ncbi:MAG: PspC domain-containing protein [Bacteroidota bacterium]|nr:PspC domain-containing protein [Bacteroidota bacterium]
MYRDEDDKVIAGVCSGISSYFGIDPLWLRLAFAVAFFAFGTGLLLYLILWLVIPAAKTAAQKLEMRGMPVNISNISKKVKEEALNIKNEFDKWSKGGNAGSPGSTSGSAYDANSPRDRFSAFGQDAGGRFISFLREFLRLAGKLVGALLIFASVTFIVSFIFIILVGMGVVAGEMPLRAEDVFRNDTVKWIALSSLFFVVFIPLIALTQAGMKLTFNVKSMPRPLTHTLGFLWLIALVSLGISGAATASRYKASGIKTQKYPMENVTGDTLIIRSADMQPFSGNDAYNHRRMIRQPQLNIGSSADSNFLFIETRTARGADWSEADKYAGNIASKVEIKYGAIVLPRHFYLKEEKGWHAEQVNYTLRVPKGKYIVLDENMRSYNLERNPKNYRRTVSWGDGAFRVTTIEEFGDDDFGIDWNEFD